MLRFLIIVVFFIQYTTAAKSYIGPGMAFGTLVTIFGFAIALIITVVGTLLFPFLYFYKKKKRKGKKKIS